MDSHGERTVYFPKLSNCTFQQKTHWHKWSWCDGKKSSNWDEVTPSNKQIDQRAIGLQPEATVYCNNNVWPALNTSADVTLSPLLIPVPLSPSERPEPDWQSVSNQANQGSKQPKQTAGGWAMAARCSCGPAVTSGWGSLMSNWCLSSITACTLPTPASLLNGSILSVSLPHFSLSIFYLPISVTH